MMYLRTILAILWKQEGVIVKQHVPVAPPEDLANVGAARALPRISFFTAFARFVGKTLTIVGLEIRKIRHDPTDLATRAVQPMLWLLIFGEVFAHIRAIPTGGRRYLDFFGPGFLAQSGFFFFFFLWVVFFFERRLGIVSKFFSSPSPRTALVLGKALSAGVRGLSQAIIIYVLALVLGVRMNWDVLALVGVLIIIMLGAASFSTFSLIIACLVKTRERFMGIGQVLTMPLFFASNAIYPVVIMPAWLQVIARGNPLSYEVDALRSMMLANEPINTAGLLMDFAVMLAVTTVLILIGARLYPRVAQ